MSGDPLAVAWTAVAGAAAVAWSVPAAVVLVECVASLLPRRRRADPVPQGPRPRVAVLVPAHDEEEGIGVALDSVRGQLREGDRLCVVAHNCRDATARVAREHGAEARAADEPEHAGKVWALRAGLAWLAEDPREVVVVLDADCVLTEGAIDRLAARVAQSGRPAQATYLMHAPREAGARGEISGFAVVVRNLARPLGLERLGLPTTIFGSGIAYPWTVLRDHPFNADALAEDYWYALALARRGIFVDYCPDVRVDSRLPDHPKGATGQRRRWEQGQLALIGSVPGILLQALARRSLPLAALALDAAVPPLAFLVVAGIVVAALAATLALAGGAAWPLVVVGGGLAGLVVALLAVRSRHAGGRPSLLTMLRLPAYVLWKIPLYVGFVVKRETRWLRTSRGDRKR